MTNSKRDRYARFAADTRAQAGFDATFIKFDFSNGAWSVGKDPDVVDLTDRELLADIDALMDGWRKYDDRSKQFAYAMVRVAGDVGIPDRALLGDMDELRWPTPKSKGNGAESNASRRDPWRRAAGLPLYSPDRPEDALLFIAEASSLDTVADLADAFTFRGEDDVARVMLGSVGPNRGGYYRAILRIIGWEARPADAKRLVPPPLPRPVPPAPQDLPF